MKIKNINIFSLNFDYKIRITRKILAKITRNFNFLVKNLFQDFLALTFIFLLISRKL